MDRATRTLIVLVSALWSVGCGASLTDLVRANDMVGLQSAVSKGADVNERDEYHNTPLVAASYRCRDDAVALLLRAGAHPDARNGAGYTPLGAAIYCGSPSTVRILLTARANPNAMTHNGRYSDHVRAFYSPLATVLDELVRGAEPRPGSSVGTPRSYLEMTQLLLAAGANPNIGRIDSEVNDTPDFPIEIAARCASASGKATRIDTTAECQETITLLATRGANLNQLDRSGDNAFTAAFHLEDNNVSAENFKQTILLLTRFGARPTPSHIASMPARIGDSLVWGLKEKFGESHRDLRLAQLKLALAFGADMNGARRAEQRGIATWERSPLLTTVGLAARRFPLALDTAVALLELGASDSLHTPSLEGELIGYRNAELLSNEEWKTARSAGVYSASAVLSKIAHKQQIDEARRRARVLLEGALILGGTMIVGAALATPGPMVPIAPKQCLNIVAREEREIRFTCVETGEGKRITFVPSEGKNGKWCTGGGAGVMAAFCAGSAEDDSSAESLMRDMCHCK